MGIFDNIEKAAEKALDEHPDQAEAAVEKAAAVVDERTGGQHHDQVEAAKAKAHDLIEERRTPGA
jgi:hypothetical protein